MCVYTVSFFGHRIVENPIAVEKRLEEIVRNLISSKAYVMFLVGRDGDFDLLAASVVHRCQRVCRSDNSSLVWIMPYVTAEYRDHQEAFQDYYDEIEVCESRYYKGAFQERNRSMVDRSDLIVSYIRRKTGGAWNTIRYAEKRNHLIINIDC